MNPAQLLFRSGKNWLDNQAANWAAAIAFYTMLSAGPLLYVAVAVAGLVFGKEAAGQAMQAQVSHLLGAQASGALQGIMHRVGTDMAPGWLAYGVGFATLLFGASGVFTGVQDAMNAIWRVRIKKSAGVLATLRKRLTSATMALGLGFQLMVSLVLDGALSAAWQRTGATGTAWVRLGESLVNLALAVVLLAAMFRFLPSTRLRWRNAFVGAGFTAILLQVGKYIIGRYLGASGAAAPFGAAGTLALILIWVYYASQILLLGAAFTQVLSRATGSGPVPDEDAEAVVTVAVPSTDEG